MTTNQSGHIEINIEYDGGNNVKLCNVIDQSATDCIYSKNGSLNLQIDSNPKV